MNDRIDERNVKKYLYGLAGRAGTFCVDGDMRREPEYIKAEWLWLTLERSELEALLMPIVGEEGGINAYPVVSDFSSGNHRFLE